MALAVLGSRNELYPTDPMAYMRNPLAEFPNPNPRLAFPPPSAAAAVSEDSSSFARRPPGLAAPDYVVYNLASYSKAERRELRRRLVSELERVQGLVARIESAGGDATPRCGRPPAPAVISLDSPDARNPAKPKVKKGLLPPPPASGKKGKPATAEMKRCVQILGRLRRHKDCWIFLEPVDTEKWALHDYHQIIRRPMDLGTVKNNLDAGAYASPDDFATDVRLTFTNALTYNPQGHDVYKWAAYLLGWFDQMFRTQFPASTAAAASPALPAAVARSKLPKPKAKDAYKRDMSYEEKQKLGDELTSLPQDKMDQVLLIVERRNKESASEQFGDEVELDMEKLDVETLWELDRFVGNCKKSLSKLKRQTMTAATAAPGGIPAAADAVPLPVIVSVRLAFFPVGLVHLCVCVIEP